MKDGYFGGFDFVRTTEGEELEIRIVETNDSSRAYLYENEHGEVCITSYDTEALLCVRGAFLCAIERINKHLEE